MSSPAIAHLTSVHPRYDTRIFMKEARSLARAGYAVSLVVADGKGDEVKDGVSIVDAGATTGGRLSRMRDTARRVFDKAIELDADLYHIHDPELLPTALKLKKRGKTVIFDSHEDFPADILTKPYLGRFARIAISRLFGWYERWSTPKLAHVVTATPAIRRKFEGIGCKPTDVNNFPLREELTDYLPWERERKLVCYVGAMTTIRGVPEVVDAMAGVASDVRLALVGEFTEAQTRSRCLESPGWTRVDEKGLVSRGEVRRIMADCAAGIVTFLPAPNHVDAQPNKMFEYMSAGIPVIGSDFPLWREIIEGNGCGICVDPTDPAAIAKAIDRLYGNQDEARAMGERGRAAVQARYNWDGEVPKLLALYERLLKG